MIRSSTAAGIALLAAAIAFLGAPAVHAQATRTWVSGVGDDANPCSRTAPCKTFAGAISKTAAKGEISVLDPGGYGAVTITKSITISGDGTLAGILSAGTNGIVVNAGVNDVVIIRNLSIHGAETGQNGINFLAGGELHVQNCTISGLAGQGINFAPSGASALFVSRTTIANANAGAIYVIPGPSGSATAAIDGATMQGNARGIRAEGGATVVVRNSVANGNNANGFVAIGMTRPVDMTLENSVSSHNGAAGVHAGELATVRLSNVVITNNAVGLEKAGTGNITSFGNNKVHGNSTNGTPSATIPQT
ncbi:MAG: right-handed parallel beta-helix repeat-containing protein [Burkholderiales bacterium]|nr:right-handed parallel beta-helix repeat-containing protein [Burkholderiales bacterium]